DSGCITAPYRPTVTGFGLRRPLIGRGRPAQRRRPPSIASVSLHLFDSATRGVRPFEPLKPGTASIYLCGATVQAPPHIGHIRSGVHFAILRRGMPPAAHEM